ncbi:MAG: PH domain-containing protein [Candidatus Bathyarchaeota archaeon]|nr:PH domain-containing protein [Candidatus Bathyarchaeota archaeon]
MAENSEPIPSLPLVMRRRLLGYMIPAFNLPLFAWNAWQTILLLQAGMTLNSMKFLEELIVIVSALGLAVLIPMVFPVYTSKYSLTNEGLTISRFLKKTQMLPYKDIDRAEVYIRIDEELSKESNEYATNQSAILRKSGFKFKDFTNGEDKIMNLFTGKDIYMISPEKPKVLLKELKRRNSRLTARIVELTRRGKRVQDLGK